MNAMRWLALFAAAATSFLAAGICTILLLLAFGQSLLGWHDNIGPEVRWGFIMGLIAALAAGTGLYQRWSSGVRKP